MKTAAWKNKGRATAASMVRVSAAKLFGVLRRPGERALAVEDMIEGIARHLRTRHR